MPTFTSAHPGAASKPSRAKTLPVDIRSLFFRLEDLTPDQREQRVTIWNRTEHRKIAGSAAPLRRNLDKYLKKHLECDVFVGQDSWDATDRSDRAACRISDDLGRVDIWNRVSKRRITGRSSPLRRYLLAYLARNPNSEVYTGQDKQPEPSRPPLRNIRIRRISPRGVDARRRDT